MQELRSLTPQEIERLQSQNCECADWTRVKVSARFNPHFIKNTRFSGKIKLGVLENEFELAGGYGYVPTYKKGEKANTSLW